MKKFIIPLIVFAVFVFAGDWLYEDIEHATGTVFSFDKDSADYVGKYSNTYEVGNGKKLPEYLFITSFMTPDTGAGSAAEDTIRLYIRLDYSNDLENWIADPTLDTIALDSTQVSDGAEVQNYNRWEPLAYRYFRLYVSTYMDTANSTAEFEVEFQKSIESD